MSDIISAENSRFAKRILIYTTFTAFQETFFTRRVKLNYHGLGETSTTFSHNCDFFFITLIRACVANEIFKKGRLCTRGGGGGQSSELSVGGVTFRFLNRDAISDQTMPFLYIYVYTLSWFP